MPIESPQDPELEHPKAATGSRRAKFKAWCVSLAENIFRMPAETREGFETRSLHGLENYAADFTDVIENKAKLIESERDTRAIVFDFLRGAYAILPNFSFPARRVQAKAVLRELAGRYKISRHDLIATQIVIPGDHPLYTLPLEKEQWRRVAEALVELDMFENLIADASMAPRVSTSSAKDTIRLMRRSLEKIGYSSLTLETWINAIEQRLRSIEAEQLRARPKATSTPLHERGLDQLPVVLRERDADGPRHTPSTPPTAQQNDSLPMPQQEMFLDPPPEDTNAH